MFLSEEWKKEKFRQRLAMKTLYITVEDACIEILPDDIVTLNEDLHSSQEEADTRLLFHASHAARNGYSSIVICSEDTGLSVVPSFSSHHSIYSIFKMWLTESHKVHQHNISRPTSRVKYMQMSPWVACLHRL